MERMHAGSSHSRYNSTSVPTRLPAETGSPQLHNPSRETSYNAPHYTVFIRLPFPRNGFQDPPPVEWDISKDKALWKLISSASSTKEINFEAMSKRFDVSLPFLLKQAAWLYERHFASMKAQMKRLSEPNPAAAFPTDSTAIMEPAQRVSGADSSTSMQKGSALRPAFSDGLAARGDTQHALSPSASSRTVTQSRTSVPSIPLVRSTSKPQSSAIGLGLTTELSRDVNEQATPVTDLFEDGKATYSIARRGLIPTKPAGARQVASNASVGNDDDDEDAGSLPFAAYAPDHVRPTPALQAGTKSQHSPAVTARAESRPEADDQLLRTQSGKPEDTRSNVPIHSSSIAKQSEPLSPQQRAQLEKLSPRHKKSDSNSSPSMGSSFSDLDEASVTQSALEDALMSNMQHGCLGLGSRMSNFRDALSK